MVNNKIRTLKARVKGMLFKLLNRKIEIGNKLRTHQNRKKLCYILGCCNNGYRLSLNKPPRAKQTCYNRRPCLDRMQIHNS